MKRLIIVLAVCILMAGVLAADGTFAFPNISDVFSNLVDKLGANGTPEKDETIFNVELISQIRDDKGNLIQTTVSPMLLPAVSTSDLNAVNTMVDGKVYELWENKKGITDKFVSVVNRSVVDDTANPSVSHNAYFRIAFAVQEEAFPFLHLNFNNTDYKWSDWKEIRIDGRSYRMIVATYPQALPVNETSPAALMQVALDRNTTSEDAEKISGNFLQIRVLAIDSAPFDNLEYNAELALDAALPLNNLNPF